MIRYGILGCGGHGIDAHAVPVPGLQLVSLCDASHDRLTQLEADNRFNSKVCYFTDPVDFLQSDLDAVIIATPDRMHIQHMMLALEARKHILVEKPLATDSIDLDILKVAIEGAKNEGLVLTSCHPRRFDSPFLWLKQHSPEFIEELGPVIGFHFDFSYHKPTAMWKHNRSLMLDHLNHEIDLLHFLYGHSTFSADMDFDSFDAYQVRGHREDGISFHFHGTRKLEKRVFLEWAVVRHERGDVSVNTNSGIACIRPHEEQTKNSEHTRVVLCGSTDYVLRNQRLMQNFADTINGNAKNYLSPEDLWTNNWLGIYLSENRYYRPSK